MKSKSVGRFNRVERSGRSQLGKRWQPLASDGESLMTQPLSALSQALPSMPSDEQQPNATQSTPESSNAMAVLGTVLLFSGAGFVFLLMIARSPESTIALPRFLYQNRDLWLVAGGGMVAVGMLCLKQAGAATSVAESSPFSSVVLYTRSDCPLCDEAKEVLNKYRARLPGIDEVDIDDDTDLTAEFGEWVPVVEIDGKVRFRGRIDEMLFRRLMDGTENLPARKNGEGENA